MISAVGQSISQVLGGTLYEFIMAHGPLAVFVLMALEGSSLPIPSEVVLPLAGYFAAGNSLYFYGLLAAAVLGSVVGLAVDYYIGYFVGKDVVYKHAPKFHIKTKTIDRFDAWFSDNGVAVVLLSRLIPVIRTIISFPAGFARMDQRTFFAYSIAGTVIWDATLMYVGMYFGEAALGTGGVTSAILAMTLVGVLAIASYAVYRHFARATRI